jgi:hypothetical protein
VVVGIGTLGVVVAFVSLLGRLPALMPFGVFATGAAYAVALGFRSGAVDAHAPLVAAGLFIAAECGYVSLGWRTGRPSRELFARGVVFTLAATVGAALVGALVLVAASDSSRGLGLEIVGAAAALLVLGVIAAFSSRSST